MAYYKNSRQTSYARNRFNGSGRAKKHTYTQAEKIAFRMGQEQKVTESLHSTNKNTRVFDAFCKGYNGRPVSSKKSLY